MARLESMCMRLYHLIWSGCTRIISAPMGGGKMRSISKFKTLKSGNETSVYKKNRVHIPSIRIPEVGSVTALSCPEDPARSENQVGPGWNSLMLQENHSNTGRSTYLKCKFT